MKATIAPRSCKSKAEMKRKRNQKLQYQPLRINPFAWHNELPAWLLRAMTRWRVIGNVGSATVVWPKHDPRQPLYRGRMKAHWKVDIESKWLKHHWKALVFGHWKELLPRNPSHSKKVSMLSRSNPFTTRMTSSSRWIRALTQKKKRLHFTQDLWWRRTGLRED